jgi:hypothetical protein
MKVFIKGKPNWARVAVKDGKRVIVERKAYGYAMGHSYDIAEAEAKEMIDREIAVVWSAAKGHPITSDEFKAAATAKQVKAKAAPKAD